MIKNWTLALVNGSHPEEGIKMELVLKRRIMNAVLTIYLPTALVISPSCSHTIIKPFLCQVLCIVYATNFFKDFFFEATQSIV